MVCPYLCAIARLCLASVFPVGIVDIIMLKYFKSLNEFINSDRYATIILNSGSVYYRNWYFSIRALGC